jgi:TatD DNase family protein
MLIDSHCHLDFPEFDKDRDEVIRRAKSAGIGYIINIGSSLSGSKKALELSRQHNFIYATIGLHPHEADKFDDEVKAGIAKLAREDKVVAIGETGLDYYKNYSKTDGSTALTISPEWNRRAENQKALFRYLVKLARDSSLPLVIHNRQAQDDTLNILNGALPIKAVVHCFSGDENFLKKCLDLGFFISFTCNITYKKTQDLRTFVKLTPLDRLMLETDAPFLPPEGFRGKRNEPAYVKFLAEEIARIKEVGFEEIARITTENARRFFNLK